MKRPISEGRTTAMHVNFEGIKQVPAPIPQNEKSLHIVVYSLFPKIHIILRFIILVLGVSTACCEVNMSRFFTCHINTILIIFQANGS